MAAHLEKKYRELDASKKHWLCSLSIEHVGIRIVPLACPNFQQVLEVPESVIATLFSGRWSGD